jgi:hypothetical protein
VALNAHVHTVFEYSRCESKLPRVGV